MKIAGLIDVTAITRIAIMGTYVFVPFGTVSRLAVTLLASLTRIAAVKSPSHKQNRAVHPVLSGVVQSTLVG